MKIDPDDPKLTAYALGELSGEERRAVEQALASSPDARAAVHETQQLARLLRRDFTDELEQPVAKPANIMPLPEEQSFWSDARWPSISIAALLAVAFLVGAVVLGGRFPWSAPAVKEPTTVVQMEFPSSAPDASDVAAAAASRESGFVAVEDAPISAFPLRVGKASYAEMRRAISAGEKPSRDAVRIEEMINAFAYEYPEAESGRAFALVLQAASCPWEPKHRLVRIALKSGERVRAAELQVLFNAARVSSYRLLGFDNRASGNRTADEEITAGQTVTALYEVVPAPNEGQPVASKGPVDALKPNTGLRPPASIDVLPPPSAELLTVKLRYRPSSAPERTDSIEKPLFDSAVDFHNASADLKFAAAVARFGMLLRGDVDPRDANANAIIRWAEEGSVGPSAAERAEFIQLARKAESLLF
jgi:hypothetical protein